MIIGVPREIKDNENRVAITASGVKAFCDNGHQVLIGKDAGLGSGISDEEYIKEGAEIIPEPEELYNRAEMIMKVKEPLTEEYSYYREGQILFAYLHLAAEETLTRFLMDKGVIAIAYETIQLEDGSLPLLIPMSEVAGRLAIQAGANFLGKPYGGKGILLGGVPGVKPARVVIIGGGTVGINAARMALGLGADVTVLDISISNLKYIDDIFSGRVKTVISSNYHIREEVSRADLVIGAVLIPGARTPHLVTEEMVREMQEGSVIIDVAIDQGGCIETAHPTTHTNPIFIKHGVVHYSVANMPGAVARTSTFALTNATLPYGLEIADKGYQRALRDNQALAFGLNIIEGKVVYRGVAEAFNLVQYPLEKALASFK